MPQLFPATYWVGFVLLAAATIMWFLFPGTEGFNSALLTLWAAFIFVGPEFMEAYPRSPSSYGQAWGVAYVRNGLPQRFGYFPYLGFHYLFAIAVEILNITYIAMIRTGMIVVYLALLLGLFLFVTEALSDNKSRLLAALIALAMLSVGGVIFTPSSLGFAFLLFCLFLLLQRRLLLADRVTLMVFYCASVVTHGLSSLMVVYLVVSRTLVHVLGGLPGRQKSLETTWLSLLFGVIFAAWLLYSNDYLFGKAVVAFLDNVLRGPFAFTSAVHHVSPFRPGRTQVVVLTLLFLAILLFWLLSILLRRRFWSRLTVERLFPLVFVIGMPPLILGTGNFTYEGLIRVFLYAIPFLALFLARESRIGVGTLTSLLILLTLGFVLLYAREFEELPPRSKFAEANFVLRAVDSNSTILQGECLPAGAMINTVRGPTGNCLALSANLPVDDPRPKDYTFTIISRAGEMAVRFALGEDRWRRFSLSVQSDDFGRVYSNGQDDVYLRQGTP